MCLPTIRVIDSPVTALPFTQQMNTILEWAKIRTSKVVCVANVHMLMEAHWHLDFSSVLQSADLVTPDGMPLVWMMRLMGARTQDRVPGLDIILSVCKLAEVQNVGVYFLGSHAEILNCMRERLRQDFPNLQIAGMEPLPFRPLTQAEDEALIQQINESGAGVAFIALGCPKQEYWMAEHKNKIQSVMIGVGGAFPVYAGIHKRAPSWIRATGLEWLYRFIQEPGRLWRRYGTTIPPFVFLALKQLVTRPFSQQIFCIQPQPNSSQVK
ncbi:MAG TPA: WecB/TagA/CpsF family glycosyltransferase [Crinalium sp.]|jgi:N-acetylglucosaminyldiphosphoundecaprenol N-acetyl-beta-D-mannosaminyltransferase